MNRRDLIIIGALVNAGVLAILFMLAIQPSEEKPAPLPAVAAVEEAKRVEPAALPAESPTSLSAEVDQAIQGVAVTQEAVPFEEILALELDEEDSPVVEIAAAQPVAAVAESPAPAPALAKEAKQEPTKKLVEITVKKGDSLDKIARANNTTIKALKEANNLKGDKLNIGQVLRIPVKKAGAAATAKATPAKKEEKGSTSKEGAEYYTVKSGDNPWKIAKQFNMKVDELLALNNLNEEKARNMKVGEKVRVRQ